MTSEILDRTEQDFDSMSVKLIRKYALWLSVFLVIESVLSMAFPVFLNLFQDSFGWSVVDTAQYTALFALPRYLGNIVITLMVYQDMQKTNTVSAPLIILTLLFDEIGVCLFILLVLYKELMKRIDENAKGQAS